MPTTNIFRNQGGRVGWGGVGWGVGGVGVGVVIRCCRDMAAFLENNRPVHPVVHHWFIIFHFQLGSNPSHCRLETDYCQGQNIHLFTLPTGNGLSPGPKHPPLAPSDQFYCFTVFLEAPLSDPRCFSHLSVLCTCTAPVPQEPNNTVLCLHFTAGLPSLSRPEWFPQTRDFQSLYCATYNTDLEEQMLSLDCI